MDENDALVSVQNLIRPSNVFTMNILRSFLGQKKRYVCPFNILPVGLLTIFILSFCTIRPIRSIGTNHER